MSYTSIFRMKRGPLSRLRRGDSEKSASNELFGSPLSASDGESDGSHHSVRRARNDSISSVKSTASSRKSSMDHDAEYSYARKGGLFSSSSGVAPSTPKESSGSSHLMLGSPWITRGKEFVSTAVGGGSGGGHASSTQSTQKHSSRAQRSGSFGPFHGHHSEKKSATWERGKQFLTTISPFGSETPTTTSGDASSSGGGAGSAFGKFYKGGLDTTGSSSDLTRAMGSRGNTPTYEMDAVAQAEEDENARVALALSKLEDVDLEDAEKEEVDSDEEDLVLDTDDAFSYSQTSIRPKPKKETPLPFKMIAGLGASKKHAHKGETNVETSPTHRLRDSASSEAHHASTRLSDRMRRWIGGGKSTTTSVYRRGYAKVTAQRKTAVELNKVILCQRLEAA